MKLHLRAMLCHCCCSEAGAGGVIEHPSAKHQPSACFHSPPVYPKKWWALVAPSASFCDSSSSCSISRFSCLFFKEGEVWAQLSIGPTPLMLVRCLGCGSHLEPAISSGLTTPRSLIRAHLRQTLQPSSVVILGVLVPHALYNPGTDQLLWRVWA